MSIPPFARAIGVLGTLVLAGLITSCGDGSNEKLKQITIAPANPVIRKGGTLRLSAVGSFANGVQRTLEESVAWETNEPAIVTIDADGNVTGVSEGAARVSVNYQGVTASTRVRVGAAGLLSITVSPNQTSLPIGESKQLSAIGNFSDGTVQDLTQSATWSSSDSSIASVGEVGIAIANATGTATVTATSGSVSGSVTLAVVPAAVVGLKIVPSTISISLGSTRQLQAIATLSDGMTQDLTGAATWATNLPVVATVSTQGIVAGTGQGAAQISAAYQGASANAAIAVGPPALLNLTVAPNTSSLPVGESELLTATGKFSDGSTQNLTQSATWTSSATTIATVSAAGGAAAKAPGAVTISATSGSVTGSASLTVTPPAVTAVNIVPATLSMVVGSNRPLRAIATVSDGTTQDITATTSWSSANSAVASVNSNGVVMAMQIGATTIQAQANNLTGSANLTVVPLATVYYFNRANSVQFGVDGTVLLTNPGLAPGDLCAMVYVFDQNQELNECCGCSVSDSGLRTLSLVNDLTSNPLTGKTPNVGMIKIVPSNPGQNQICDPGALAPSGAIIAWGTNLQRVGGAGTFEMTEGTYETVPLADSESTFLTNTCNFARQLGSGKGICSCGTGD
jgi:hypothetical protein